MSKTKEWLMSQPEPEFQDKAEVTDLIRAALKSGFNYEYAQYANSDEYLLRVYDATGKGELTAHVTKAELLDLGMEV